MLPDRTTTDRKCRSRNLSRRPMRVSQPLILAIAHLLWQHRDIPPSCYSQDMAPCNGEVPLMARLGPSVSPRAEGGIVNRLLLIAMSVLAFAQPARTFAQSGWPDRPIRLIVPFPAGGNTDVVARLAATYIQKALAGPGVV